VRMDIGLQAPLKEWHPFLKFKTRYSTFRTVLPQIGAHSLNSVAWRLGVAVRPHAFGLPLCGFRAGLRHRAR